MSDIKVVLKDSTGDAQTFSNPTALGVDTTDGGIAVFYRKDLIPEAYTHPDTHPASMITGLADAAISGEYADIKNKPFGDIIVVPSMDYEFEKNKDLDDLYLCNLPLRDEITVGENYTVIWDGAEYTCKAKDAEELNVGFSGGIFLGNSQKILNLGFGENTGEPFVICLSTEKKTLSANTDDSSESHTIYVAPVNNVRKIDAKYLPDGVATEAYVRQEIAKSGSVVSGEGITAADVTAMLASAGVIVPVAVEDNLLLSDSEGDIYIL